MQPDKTKLVKIEMFWPQAPLLHSLCISVQSVSHTLPDCILNLQKGINIFLSNNCNNLLSHAKPMYVLSSLLAIKIHTKWSPKDLKKEIKISLKIFFVMAQNRHGVVMRKENKAPFLTADEPDIFKIILSR